MRKEWDQSIETGVIGKWKSKTNAMVIVEMKTMENEICRNALTFIQEKEYQTSKSKTKWYVKARRVTNKRNEIAVAEKGKWNFKKIDSK